MTGKAPGATGVYAPAWTQHRRILHETGTPFVYVEAPARTLGNDLWCDWLNVCWGLYPIGFKLNPHWTGRVPAHCLKPRPDGKSSSLNGPSLLCSLAAVLTVGGRTLDAKAYAFLWTVFFRAGELTPKGNPKRPSRQNVVDFVAEAWASLSEDTVWRSFKRCGISTSLNGTDDVELSDRLALVDDAAEAGPGQRESLVDEALDLIFDGDSDVSFNGFSYEH
ncbi:hypothetical protein HPB47_006071 [Ixodes persulcatus]|uniref:Uncharacterized protein n=1 Tax=Ixodes persulcatus TaxID=34615 RepID=A0AC60PB82_IXOPE|nr:hypothetical protein HPB47_006071 [Ixodes persulcatus]